MMKRKIVADCPRVKNKNKIKVATLHAVAIKSYATNKTNTRQDQHIHAELYRMNDLNKIKTKQNEEKKHLCCHNKTKGILCDKWC